MTDTRDDSPVTPEEVLKLGALGLMYFVQGLPFGYQSHALPVMLREQGASLTMITLTQALALPWMLKIFVGPFVDSAGSRRFGHRKSFILPLQLLLAATMALASFLPIERSFPLLCLLLFCMNAFAATMDVAVDGLAVDTLRPRTVGFGNAVQVMGFRLGMIVSGGVLMHFVPDIGLRMLFAILGGVTLLVHAITWRFPEHERPATAARAAFDFKGAAAAAWDALVAKEGRYLVVFLLLYKAGEAMADSVFRPMLVDARLPAEEIALSVNTYGSATALLGPLLAGFLVQQLGVRRALIAVITVRMIPIAGELCVVLGVHDMWFVIGVTSLEHLVGSALTTLAFAMMMSIVDPRVGATQFTALATIENLGKGFLGYLAGPIGDGLGLVGTYVIAAVLTVAFAIVTPPLLARIFATGRSDAARA